MELPATLAQFLKTEHTEVPGEGSEEGTGLLWDLQWHLADLGALYRRGSTSREGLEVRNEA